MDTDKLVSILKSLNLYSIATRPNDGMEQEYYIKKIGEIFNELNFTNIDYYHTRIIKAIKEHDRMLYFEMYAEISWMLLENYSTFRKLED